MRRLPVVLLLFLAALAFGSLRPARGQGGFIIDNADATNTLSFTASPGLSTLIGQAAPRIVFQHARSNRDITLTAAPTALSSLLASTESRIVMQHAQANRHVELSPVPTELGNLLRGVLSRVVVQHAHANRELALAYPVELVDDNRAPRGSNIEASPADETSAVISWATDEFADSTVECGTQSGSYTMTFSDPLYVKAHAVTVTGLTTGTTYYCRVSSTDLSGNTYRSQEFSFEQTAESFVYLPLVLRSR